MLLESKVQDMNSDTLHDYKQELQSQEDCHQELK